MTMVLVGLALTGLVGCASSSNSTDGATSASAGTGAAAAATKTHASAATAPTAALATGAPLDDVHCTECQAG